LNVTYTNGGLQAAIFLEALNVAFCGNQDISRDPGIGGYAAHPGQLADRNITIQ
jgi:hypothetical protein